MPRVSLTIDQRTVDVRDIWKEEFDMEILSFSGARRAGKDTGIDLMIQELTQLGIKAEKTAWAGPLRAEIARGYPSLDMNLLDHPSLKETPNEQLALRRCTNKDFLSLCVAPLQRLMGKPIGPDTPLRPDQIQQVWGTEYRRQSMFGHETYWIDKQRELIESAKVRQVDFLFISGTRFDNERDLVKELEGVLIRVNRSSQNNNDSELIGVGHPSDWKWREWEFDRVFTNQDGDSSHYLDSLREMLVDLGADLPMTHSSSCK